MANGVSPGGPTKRCVQTLSRSNSRRPRMLRRIARPLLVVASGMMPFALHAEPGVFDDRIVFGESAAFEGPASALGLGMREGILAAFNEANAAGGVHGRKLELISYDDGYEPDKAIANTNRLINDDKVFALIGEVGTPTSQAAQPIATEARVPFIGPFTGAGFLRDPALDNVINVRASYGQETETWIEHLTTDLGVSRIAILYQNDGFGQAGLSGVVKALDKRGMKLAAEGTYERNTIEVEAAVEAIAKADPEAVVMVGAYKPCAEFIRQARAAGLNATFVNISFVGTNALAKELGKDGEAVVVTQVVPFPEDTSVPLVAQYQKALKAASPEAEFGFVSLEGYMVGRLVVQALEQSGEAVTRDGLLATIEKVGEFDLGGVTLTYGPDDNQGMDQVFLTVIQSDGSIKPVDRLTKT
ncbi:MAG TPA: ABC transporter substrate-binding protein [Geminicoccaceae bacterium]|nr:ABC transporter substrate-binding protein [Geminicoccaceae bacterium]